MPESATAALPATDLVVVPDPNPAAERGEPCGCGEHYEARFPGITETERPHVTACANTYPRPVARPRRPRRDPRWG